jgi:hypothetical protein
MERAAHELSQVIYNHFSMHPARLKCLLAMIWSIIGAKKAQIWALAEQFGGDARLESRAKRISRFLAKQALSCEDVARCITELLSYSEPWTLVMDRTNWDFGKTVRNYLVLAVVYNNNAVPLFIKDLEHAGNSDTEERIALMTRFLTVFGKDKVHCLLMDREFIGEEWLTWLIKNNIRPCVRMRNNTLVRHRNGGKVPVINLLRALDVGASRAWEEKLYGYTFQMVGMKINGGEFLVLLAPLDLRVALLPLYKIRWAIECLFKNAKSSGFLWESTHIISPQRAEKLAFVLALAAALVIKEAVIQHALKPIPFRKTVNASLYSFFTYGLRILANALRHSISNPINNHLIVNRCYKSVQ